MTIKLKNHKIRPFSAIYAKVVIDESHNLFGIVQIIVSPNLIQSIPNNVLKKLLTVNKAHFHFYRRDGFRYVVGSFGKELLLIGFQQIPLSQHLFLQFITFLTERSQRGQMLEKI